MTEFEKAIDTWFALGAGCTCFVWLSWAIGRICLEMFKGGFK